MRRWLRMIWAVFRQEWHLHTCKGCREGWLCASKACDTNTECPDCEALQMERWAVQQMLAKERQ